MQGRQARRHTYRVGLCLVAASLLGCDGVIGTADSPNGAASGGGRPGSGTGANGVGGAVSCTAGQLDPGPTFLRRLTNQEYQATVRLVLGDGIDEVSADFPP